MFPTPDDGGLTAPELSAQAGAAVALPAGGSDPGVGVVLEPEARAFDALEEATLASGKLIQPKSLELLRASASGATGALLLRSPEPIRWERTSLVLEVAPSALVQGIPGDFKLTGVAFASTPDAEAVSVLVRAPSPIASHRLDWRPLPDATTPDPAWTAYFTFADDDSVSDGVEIDVFSGTATSSQPVGTTARYGSAGSTVFPASGVELRLVAPDGQVVHQRQFFPDSSFAAVDASAIRKLDGTACFLLPAAGSVANTGVTLRARFTFHRNAGADLPVFREAGSDSDESVVLDVPLG